MRREHEVLFEDLVLYRRVGVLISVAAAVCWTLAYSFIIRRGFKDRMPGMPLAALSANIVWEAVSVVWYVDGDIKLLIMQGVWLGFDLPILVQILRFGRNQPQHALLAKHYHLIVIASLVAFGMVFAGFTAQFGDKTGWMIAFLQNLMMSTLFVAMILRRDNVEGQSLYIAIFKFLGTFSAFLLATYWCPLNWKIIAVDWLPSAPTPMYPLVAWTYPLIFVLDLLYIGLVYRKSRELGLDPWRRY